MRTTEKICLIVNFFSSFVIIHHNSQKNHISIMHIDLVDSCYKVLCFLYYVLVSTYSHLGEWCLSLSRVINQNMAMNHIADKWISGAYEKPKYQKQWRTKWKNCRLTTKRFRLPTWLGHFGWVQAARYP